jgi:hypothetical protein
MKNINKLYSILLLLLFSCSGTEQYKGLGDAGFIIPLPENNDVFNWTDRIEDYFYLPLETEGAILQDIKQIIFHKEQILVSDRRILNCYDSTGKLCYSIDRTGKGPGEYLSIDSFDCQGESIFIYDNNSKRVSVYDMKNGQFKQTIDINGNFLEMKSLKNKFIFYASNGLNDIQNDYEITILDNKDKIRQNYFRNSSVDFQDGFLNQLTRNDQEVYYANSLSNIAFKIDSFGNIQAHALIDFYRDAKIHNLKDLGKDMDSRQELTQSNLYYGLTQWIENKSYIHFCIKKNEEHFWFLFSKDQKRTYNLNDAKSSLPIFLISSPIATYKEYFVRPVDSYYFSKINKNKLDLKDSLTAAIYSQVKNIKPNDNPTLLFYKIKY